MSHVILHHVARRRLAGGRGTEDCCLLMSRMGRDAGLLGLSLIVDGTFLLNNFFVSDCPGIITRVDLDVDLDLDGELD